MKKTKLPQPTRDCPCCKGTGKVRDHTAFGEQMQARRKAADITLKTLAERTGYSVGYWSDLEHGRRHWSDDLAARYLAALEGERKS